MAAEGSAEVPTPHGRTPARLKYGMELMVRARAGRIHSQGLEHLETLPPDRPIVFAPSHITDLDVPIVGKLLADTFDLGVVDISKIHEVFGGDLVGYLSSTLVGRKNYFPLDYGREGGKWVPGVLNIENFEPAAQAMKHDGKSMLVAAHNPTYDHILPPEGGFGAVILAQMARAIVVPIAVDVHVPKSDIGKKMASDTWKMVTKRPGAQVTVGEPIDLLPIQGFEQWVQDLRNRHTQRADGVKDAIRSQSSQIMRAIAFLLPSEKRGVWQDVVR